MSKSAPQMPPIPPAPPPTPVKAIKPEKTVRIQEQRKLRDPKKVGPKQTVLKMGYTQQSYFLADVGLIVDNASSCWMRLDTIIEPIMKRIEFLEQHPFIPGQVTLRMRFATYQWDTVSMMNIFHHPRKWQTTNIIHWEVM